MRKAKDYIREDGPGKQTITSLAYWLTPDGLSNPLEAALLRKAMERSTDDEFSKAFDGATKAEARKVLATYERCAMPYWGAEELAAAIHDADSGRDERVALRAITLAQKIGEVPDTFKPREGIEWAMARGYLIDRLTCQFVGAHPGVFGHPHTPMPSEPRLAELGKEPASTSGLLDAPVPVEATATGTASLNAPAGGKSTPRSKWDENRLRKLYSESILPGATPAKLALQYGISRQGIAKQIKAAEKLCRADRRPKASSIAWKSQK